MKRVLIVGLLILGPTAAGCAWHHPSDYAIPWWKGIPAQVLAPSSLEAEAWRDQHHGQQYTYTYPGHISTYYDDGYQEDVEAPAVSEAVPEPVMTE